MKNMLFRLLMILLILLISLIGVVMGQDTEDDVTELLESRAVAIQPLETIYDGSPPRIVGITDTSARLEFIGTIPLACSIVYGTTTDFGLLSVDADMDGGAHIDHGPLMLNLEPDTEYYYRLQGSAEDGTFFVSEVSTFITLPASTEAKLNLLSPDNGAEIMAVSSNFGGQDNDGNWGINNAFDNNPNTAWSSNGDGSKAFVEVQLAERSRIDRVEFWTRTMSNDTAQIFEFMITTDEGETHGPFTLPDAEQAYEFEVEFEATSLRFEVMDSNGGNTGAIDIAVYGEAVGK